MNSKKNKILYVLLHGSMMPERHKNVMDSWGKDVKILFYSDHSDTNNKIHKVSDRTDYHSNEDKHIGAWKLIKSKKLFKNFEWIFFCDDDTFVNYSYLEDNLDYFDKSKITGHVLQGTWPQDRSLNYCSGGAGYLVHSKNVEFISKNIELLNTGYSDVTLGLFCRRFGIEFAHDDRFNPNDHEGKIREGTVTSDIRYNNIEDPSKFFSHHYIKTSEEMNKLYELSKK